MEEEASKKPVKTPRPKTKVVKRPAKKKAIESIGLNLDEDLDNPESEVELDSLGSLFIHLIDNDYYQDDAEGSQADDAEVITLPSGSDTPSTQKIRQTIRKINFLTPCSLGPKISFEEAAARSSPHNPAQRPSSHFGRFTKHSGSETST